MGNVAQYTRGFVHEGVFARHQINLKEVAWEYNTQASKQGSKASLEVGQQKKHLYHYSGWYAELLMD